MKVAFLNGVNSGFDSVRGIGAHTTELLKQFRNYQFSPPAGRAGISNFQITNDVKEADIVHITKFHPFFVSIPFKKPAKKVVLTIHDLIPLVYPKNYTPGLKGKIKFLINKFLIQKNVDAIVTISETSKKDICRFLAIEPAKIRVIGLSARKIFKQINNKKKLDDIKKKYKLPDSFALYVGDVNFNKNILTLLKACRIVDIQLVICGKQALEIESDINISKLNGPMDYVRYLFGKPHPEIAHLIELNESIKNVQRLGFITDEDLVLIYNLASVYIQPSLYEGFGLPVLEAMASGCPVIVSKTQALVEIIGNAAQTFDPESYSDLSNKISLVTSNGKIRESFINAGFGQAAKFSWEKTAQETMRLYKDILSK